MGFDTFMRRLKSIRTSSKRTNTPKTNNGGFNLSGPLTANNRAFMNRLPNNSHLNLSKYHPPAPARFPPLTKLRTNFATLQNQWTQQKARMNKSKNNRQRILNAARQKASNAARQKASNAARQKAEKVQAQAHLHNVFQQLANMKIAKQLANKRAAAAKLRARQRETARTGTAQYAWVPQVMMAR